MGVYDRQVAQALRMIHAKGQLVNWVKSGHQADNSKPWKSTDVPPNPQTYQVYIVFTTAGSSKLNALIHLITGTAVPTGAPAGLMAQVKGFTPEIGDSVNRSGDVMVIKSIDIVAPNGAIILYKLVFA